MAQKRKKVISIAVLLAIVASAALALVFIQPQSSLAKGSSSSVTDYATPGVDPWGTALDGGGNVWVALPGCDPSPSCATGTPAGKIGVFNPGSRTWTHTYQLPTGYGQALFLAFDRSGQLWFPMPTTNSLGVFNPATNSFNQWKVPTAGSGPWDIAIDSKGIIWFTEHYSNKIGSFNPATHAFKEVATPAGNSLPYGITVDKSDNIWFTENNDAVALIGEYTAQGVLQEYKIRNGSTKGLTPHMITTDGSGNVWWSEGWVAMIGKLNVASAQPGTNSGVTEYAYHPTCANCGTHTSGISVGPDGLIWFDDSLQSIYGSFNPGSGAFSLYNTPTQSSHPHDGLKVDGQNRVWFDEEFAGKLAVRG
ncbi:hypothetical protein EPA93_40365 [Ktedonosporobacter rubrisoli]|uniref:Lyase n=1 Tax=Ktedonosporobacter rubrisoli TaxID=2509675 RepID=A0A4P6K1F0_KTERU|nr:hypothetical protein [Ktedonosporobacter rubrisoli]QBD81899.1 hypothetical protein EPA93_40365 [Ktedonosporobacter rubrisoli]